MGVFDDILNAPAEERHRYLEELLYKGKYVRDEYGLLQKDSSSWRDMSVSQILAMPVENITSLDMIINPYDVISPSDYKNNKTGLAQYNSDLAALQQYATMQKAWFDNWYNSEAQQALRQEQAGLNPNLTGVQPSSSSDVSQMTSNPKEGFETDLQTALNTVNVVSSLVGSVASVASLPFSIGAQKAAMQGAKVSAEGVQLDNIGKFEALAYADIAGQFANATASAVSAGTAFDTDSWFKDTDFSSVLSAYAPSDNPQYRAALGRAVANVQRVKGDAYKLGADVESNKSDFVKMLADPYRDEDVTLQLSYMEPVMKAIEQKRLLLQDYEMKLTELRMNSELPSLEQEYSARKAEYKYKTDYFNGFDGDEVALYEFMIKKNQALSEQAKGQIYDNWFQGWREKPTSPQGLRYAYLIANQGHLPWYEFLVSYGFSSVAEPFQSDSSLDDDTPRDKMVEGLKDAGGVKLPSSLIDSSSDPYPILKGMRFGD